MTNLTELAPPVFNFGLHAVRVITLEGQPWFVLTDVCRALNLSNPSMVAQRLQSHQRSKLSLGRQGEAVIVNESGLYRVVLRSDSPQAEPFQVWVTEEVLPSIRQTGSYALTPARDLPQSMPEALRRLADSLEAEARAKEQLALAAPKVEAFDALMDSQGTYLVREVAKLLGVGGQNRLYQLMREHHIIIPGTCEPYQKHVDAGHFVIKTLPYKRGDQMVSSRTTYVTTRGLEYLRRKLATDVPLSLPRPILGEGVQA